MRTSAKPKTRFTKVDEEYIMETDIDIDQETETIDFRGTWPAKVIVSKAIFTGQEEGSPIYWKFRIEILKTDFSIITGYWYRSKEAAKAGARKAIKSGFDYFTLRHGYLSLIRKTDPYDDFLFYNSESTTDI